MNLHNYIRTVEDFPEEGVKFQDISPMLENPEARQKCVSKMASKLEGKVDSVAGLGSRGFLYTSVADELNTPFYMVRKGGKLPEPTETQTYGKEYGEDELELNPELIDEDERVGIVDDLLATGGTMEAAAQLVEEAGGEPAYCVVPIELEELNGREKLENQGYEVGSVLVR